MGKGGGKKKKRKKKKEPPTRAERAENKNNKTPRRRKNNNNKNPKQNNPRSFWVLCRNHNLYIPLQLCTIRLYTSKAVTLSSRRSVCVFACVLCPRWSCSWRGWGRGRRPSRRPSLRRPASRGSSRSVGERWTKKHTRDKNRRRNAWINKVSLNITSKSGQRQRQKKRSHFSPKDDISFLFLVQKFIWLRKKKVI